MNLVAGIQYPLLLAVLIGIAMVLFKLLKTGIHRSKDQQIRILAQKVAVPGARRELGTRGRSDSANE